VNSGDFESGPIRFDGQTALIACSEGEPGPLVFEFIKRGCNVVLAAREGSGIRRGNFGGKSAAEGTLHIYEYEATSEGGKRAVVQALGIFNRLDILIYIPAPDRRGVVFTDMIPEIWQRNRNAIDEMFFVTRPAFVAMRERAYGRILFSVTGEALYGMPSKTAASAASLAAVGLMNVIKLEGKKYNIGINAVVPVVSQERSAESACSNTSNRTPSCTVPLMLYLSSHKCRESGRIYRAGEKTIARAAFMTGESHIPVAGGIATAENVMNSWPEIANLSDARSYWDQNGMTGDLFEKVMKTPQEKAESAGVSGRPVKEIRFDERVAVVTGAGEGLGRTYAIELARRGASVVVNDYGVPRDGTGEGARDAADRVVEEIRRMGGTAVPQYDSVATADGGEAIMNAALDAFGRVDVLINNAGIIRDRSFVKMAPENWGAVLDVHLDGAFFVTKPAFCHMVERGYGRIIFTTSVAGLYGNFGQSNYGTAKVGIIGLMNSLKLEGAPRGITVHTIAPLAATRMNADVIPPGQAEKMDPRAVAAMVLYLASEECRLTGTIINASSGAYNRAAILTGKGLNIENCSGTHLLEAIAAAWERINDMEGATEFESADEVQEG
jgi:NAD(P)-dependent dehydrogenase (short-subunit alcohol dehydrogenase family)